MIGFPSDSPEWEEFRRQSVVFDRVEGLAARLFVSMLGGLAAKPTTSLTLTPAAMRETSDACFVAAKVFIGYLDEQRPKPPGRPS